MQREIVRECKLRGLVLRADAAQALARIVDQEADPSGVMRSVIDTVRKRIERGETRSRAVDAETVQAAFGEYFAERQPAGDADAAQSGGFVLDAWSTPKLAFDGSARKFWLEPCGDSLRSLGSVGDARSAALRARYELAWQRVVRHPMFAARGAKDRAKARESVELSRLDRLRGSGGARVCVLGVLAQVEQDVMYLEDPNSLIRCDLSNARTYGGYFCEGMIVVAEGAIDGDGAFVVDSLGHPPPETRAHAMRAIGGDALDVFGQAVRDSHRDVPPAVAQLTTWLIIAEPHLDAPLTLGRLRSLFSALAVPALRRALAAGVPKSQPTLTVVLLGDFLSPRALGKGAASAMRDARQRFAELGDLITAREFDVDGGESLASLAQFVFIPGPNDFVAGPKMLPRPKLATFVVEPLLEKLRERGARVEFSTSPARLRFGDREIVLHRDDALRKLRRLSAKVVPDAALRENFPLDATSQDVSQDAPESLDAHEHLAKTLLDQAHLSPFAAHVSPTNWEHDHALRLYPPPDALAIADASAPQFDAVYEQCSVFNPGSFARDGAFVVFKPANCSVEASQVP
ncbi:DNA polymerase alpha/epsilon subunit B-domain-containing protein [Pelagophyceae sp. CCMP2097]|nr:DNA polymerase alpha/epsilon subunit B-domain-containing protein [Pelagophyceae sp. CCMP2097]|mmetsp:Transcript_12857/g.44482  ORF Transcript_12857/g.44482 Transcript_12857/m.44482 type:complete len:574 (-) Transcript_12857:38-1759(-)